MGRVGVFWYICSDGVWKVVASFQNEKQHNYSAEFEVKEYGKTFTIVKYFRLIWFNIFNAFIIIFLSFTELWGYNYLW